ncbi:MAG: c-type cytochrome [Solirubrobacterales bacterium]
MRKMIIAAALGLLLASPARAGDAAKGADLFDTYCSECHSVQANGSQRKAPTLFGVIGRKTGSAPGFDYSDANRNAAWVWSAETLETYLVAPKQAIPGTVMKFKGIPDATERQDVIAYLATLH